MREQDDLLNMTEEDRQRVLAVEKMRALIEEGVNKKCLLSEMELEVEEQKRALGQRAMDEKLASLKPEDGRPKGCPRCGKSSKRRAVAVERTFRSLSGEHTFKRDYYYCERCTRGFYPRDEFIGLPEHGTETMELERRMADFAVNDSYEEASARWNFHYPLKTSANQFRQVVKRLGQRLDYANENPTLLHATIKPPPSTSTETLYVMNDGGMVPMRGAWQECKLGVLFRDDEPLSEQGPRRGKTEDGRYVAVLGNQDEFRAELQQALFAETRVRPKRIAWVADGLPGNWNLASLLAPNAIQILDWHHAVENAFKCGKVLFENSPIELAEWKKTTECLLWEEDSSVLQEQLKECLLLAENQTQREALEDLLRYFNNNTSRMKYAEFRRLGLLIGSGPVESAHRHVIQIRMKKAGQHWGEQGGKQMARLRAAYRTTGPERFYRAIHWASRYGPRIKKLSMFEKRRASNR